MRRVKRTHRLVGPPILPRGVKLWASSLFFRGKPSFDGLRPAGWRSVASLALVLGLTIAGIGSVLQVLSGNALAASVGPRTATSSSNCVDNSGTGTITWTSPGNAAALDSTSATASISKGGTTSTHYILCQNFGFTSGMFPTGTTITGITVSITRSANSTGVIHDKAVRLVKGGTIGTTDRSTATTWPTTLTNEDHGSSSDLWGDTWTTTDITASTFGVAFSATNTSTTQAKTASVDVIQVTVSFTAPQNLTQRHYIFQNDDGATVNANTNYGSADTALTNVRIGQRLVARMQVDNTGGDFTNGQFKIQYDKNDNNWQDVSTTTEIEPASGTSGTNGDSLTSAAAGTCTTGTSYTNGAWYEDVSISKANTLAYNACSEYAFTLDTGKAAVGTTYRLRLYDSTDGATLSGYSVYPTLTTASTTTNTIRSSKDAITRLGSPTSCADTSWDCMMVNSYNSTISQYDGRYDDIAIDPAGNPWIVSQNNQTKSFVVNQYTPGSAASGQCAANWTCTTLASDGGTNEYGVGAHILFDKTGTAMVSFQQYTAKQLYFAKYVGSGGSGCGSAGSSAWQCTMVVSSNVGSDTSIALDSHNNPWLTYQDYVNHNLFVAHYVPGTAATGNCAADWECDTVGTGIDGSRARIAIDSADNKAIAYNNFTAGTASVAKSVASGGSCPGSGGVWDCQDLGNSVSGTVQMDAVTDINNAFVATYYDTNNTALIFAQYVGSGGTGCTSTAWTCTTVDNDIGGSTAVGLYNSLAVAPDGTVYIGYYDSTNGDAKVAWKIAGGSGNCTSTAWNCTAVDTANNVGQWTNLTFDQSGVLWLAYQDVTNGDTRVAKHVLPMSYTPLRYPLDSTGYTAIASNDTSRDAMSAGTNTPVYNFAATTANNTGQITPTWIGQSNVAASTNNIHLQVYRFGTTNAWQDLVTNTTCTANTDCTITPAAITTNLSDYYQSSGSNYTVRFRVYQASGTTKTLQTNNFSVVFDSPPASPASLAQAKVTGGASVAVGGWTNENQIKLTALVSDPDPSDTLQLCVERQPLGTSFTGTETACGSGTAYSGTPVTASVNITGLADNQYHWQARVKDAAGQYSAWVSFGGNAESASDFGVDTSAPTGTVYDGTSTGVEQTFNDGTLTNLSANWNINSNTSGLATYEYSIGTTAGGTDVANWQTVAGTSVSASGLSLNTSQMYYFNIRTTDNAGNQSVISSSGQLVAPTLGFSVSSGTIAFDNLNTANSYTSTKTVNLTVTTNAHNGYQVHASATQDLTNQAARTLGMFTGGTYAAPGGWAAGVYGFGYTSSDTSVGGSNRFNSATCPGGGAAPCYAPYNKTLPGDVIADGTAPATSGDSYTITNRITTSPTQAAGKYTTTLTYSANAIY